MDAKNVAIFTVKWEEFQKLLHVYAIWIILGVQMVPKWVQNVAKLRAKRWQNGAKMVPKMMAFRVKKQQNGHTNDGFWCTK